MFVHCIVTMTIDVHGFAVSFGFCIWRWTLKAIWPWKNLPFIKHVLSGTSFKMIRIQYSFKIVTTLALRTSRLFLDSVSHAVSASFAPLCVAACHFALSCASLSNGSVLMKNTFNNVLRPCDTYAYIQWIFCLMLVPHTTIVSGVSPLACNEFDLPSKRGIVARCMIVRIDSWFARVWTLVSGTSSCHLIFFSWWRHVTWKLFNCFPHEQSTSHNHTTEWWWRPLFLPRRLETIHPIWDLFLHISYVFKSMPNASVHKSVGKRSSHPKARGRNCPNMSITANIARSSSFSLKCCSSFGKIIWGGGRGMTELYKRSKTDRKKKTQFLQQPQPIAGRSNNN